MNLFSFWFGLRAPVSRRAYLLSGVGLMVLKFAIDQGISFAATGHMWPVAAYLLPSAALKAEALGPSPDWALWALALVALPFLWVGMSMTMRRAADAGKSPWLGVLFLIPGINYVTMIVLAILPSKKVERPWVPVPMGPFRAAPDAQPLSDAGPVPADLQSALLGVISPIAIGIGMMLISVNGFKLYGSALFFATPFVMGMTTAILFNRKRLRPLSSTIGYACLSIMLTGLATLLFAIEGILCLLMAAPLAMMLASFGALVGYAMAWQARRPMGAAAMVAALPLLTGLEAKVATPTLREVTTSVEIDAPPEKVWENVVGFSELPAPPEWFFKQGIAYPMRATIEGEGVGAVRRCEFSTGAFVEPITVWDPPRHLGFDVVAQPPSMTEWSPYNGLEAPHLEGYMVSRRGEFRLIPLEGGRTRLEGSTFYTLSIFPETYWVGWGEALLHAIHGRVLHHIQDLSER